MHGYFTQRAAWECIATYLEAGGDVREVTLRKPPGARAYEMLIDVEANERPVYVKLQLGAGKVIGRSFHYSERAHGRN